MYGAPCTVSAVQFQFLRKKTAIPASNSHPARGRGCG